MRGLTAAKCTPVSGQSERTIEEQDQEVVQSAIFSKQMTATATSTTAPPGGNLGATEVRQLIEQVCPAKEYRDKRVVLIVPDGTRTAPIGLLFRALHDQIGPAAKAFDVLIALGTHPPMSEQAICDRLEISRAERSGKYAGVNVYNHEWDNPDALRSIGVIPAPKSRSFPMVFSPSRWK